MTKGKAVPVHSAEGRSELSSFPNSLYVRTVLWTNGATAPAVGRKPFDPSVGTTLTELPQV